MYSEFFTNSDKLDSSAPLTVASLIEFPHIPSTDDYMACPEYFTNFQQFTRSGTLQLPVQYSSQIDSFNLLFFINGIYDILCAISILRIIHIPILGTLHLSVIKKTYNQNSMFSRVLAYWLLTYGIMRISGNNHIIAYSYFIEAMFFGNEYIQHNSVYPLSAGFIVISSMLLGIKAYFYM